MDGVARHVVSLLTDMSFLKWQYTAKAVHEQEAERIANAALSSRKGRCKLACKSPLIVSGRFGESQATSKNGVFRGGLDGVARHGVSLLTDMSFLKWQYTAKAVHEQ